MAGLEGEMAAIVCNNPRVLEEYKEKQRQLEQLTAEWDAANLQLEELNAAIESLKVGMGGVCRQGKGVQEEAMWEVMLQ